MSHHEEMFVTSHRLIFCWTYSWREQLLLYVTWHANTWQIQSFCDVKKTLLDMSQANILTGYHKQITHIHDFNPQSLCDVANSFLSHCQWRQFFHLTSTSHKDWLLVTSQVNASVVTSDSSATIVKLSSVTWRLSTCDITRTFLWRDKWFFGNTWVLTTCDFNCFCLWRDNVFFGNNDPRLVNYMTTGYFWYHLWLFVTWQVILSHHSSKSPYISRVLSWDNMGVYGLPKVQRYKKKILFNLSDAYLGLSHVVSCCGCSMCTFDP